MYTTMQIILIPIYGNENFLCQYIGIFIKNSDHITEFFFFFLSVTLWVHTQSISIIQTKSLKLKQNVCVLG